MEEKLSARVTLIMSSGLLVGAILALSGLANGAANGQAAGDVAAQESYTHVASSMPGTSPGDAFMPHPPNTDI